MTEPSEIQAKLTTPLARQAFNILNGLGPRHWDCSEDDRGVHLNLSVQVREMNGIKLTSPSGFLAKNFDEAVVFKYAALLEAAKQPNMLVIANAHGSDRREFVFKDGVGFVPYEPKIRTPEFANKS